MDRLSRCIVVLALALSIHAQGTRADYDRSASVSKRVSGTIDRFTARYRVGVSADERRKDGKEFLIRDLFGGVAVEVPKGEMVDKGIRFIREPKVAVYGTVAVWEDLYGNLWDLIEFSHGGRAD